MNAQIEISHGDFLIYYSEYDNTWIPKRSIGSLPGCPSLAKAKESIDNLSKQEKAAFIRHNAIFMANTYTDPTKVEISSFVAKSGKLYAWIKLSDGQRRCENVDTLREFTVENVERLDRINALKKELNALREQSNLVRSALAPYVLKKASALYSSKGVPSDVAALLPK